jgi:ribosome-associated protein
MNEIREDIRYISSRSSGSGGQHVNKVSTRVTLIFDLAASPYFTAAEKEQIGQKLSSWITKSGIIQVSCDTSRSQHRNKELATARFFSALKASLKKEKPRKAAIVPEFVKQKRKINKLANSQKKEFRKKIMF